MHKDDNRAAGLPGPGSRGTSPDQLGNLEDCQPGAKRASLIQPGLNQPMNYAVMTDKNRTRLKNGVDAVSAGISAWYNSAL